MERDWLRFNLSWTDYLNITDTVDLSACYGMREIMSSITSKSWVFVTGYLDVSGSGEGGAKTLLRRMRNTVENMLWLRVGDSQPISISNMLSTRT